MYNATVWSEAKMLRAVLANAHNLMVAAVVATLLCSCAGDPGKPSKGMELTALRRQAYTAMTAKQYAKAEPLLERSQTLWISIYGNDEAELAGVGNSAMKVGRYAPLQATTYGDLAQCYEGQGKFELAEPLRRKVLTVHQKYQGQRGPLDTAVWENTDHLADNLAAQKKFDEAAEFYKAAIKIKEASVNRNDFRANRPDLYEDMKIGVTKRERAALAEVYRQQGRMKEAEELFEQVERADAGGPAPRKGSWEIQSMYNYAKLLRATDRASEADAMERNARINEEFPH